MYPYVCSCTVVCFYTKARSKLFLTKAKEAWVMAPTPTLVGSRSAMTSCTTDTIDNVILHAILYYTHTTTTTTTTTATTVTTTSDTNNALPIMIISMCVYMYTYIYIYI